MKFTRRDFVRGGVSAFSLGFAAPRFLCDIALAQGASSRNLVILYLGGGNDSLSMLVPYRDSFYQSRRPTLAVPAGQALQIGRDSAGNELGLHPRLTGVRTMFNEGRLALIQRTGYENSSRSHFEGTDIWSTANPSFTQGPGWLGRYLDTIPAPSIRCTHGTPARRCRTPSCRGSSPFRRSVIRLCMPFKVPNGTAEAAYEREAAMRMSSHLPMHRPHLAFVNATAQSAFATLDRVATVGTYVPTVTYPMSGFALALRAVAGALATQIGTRIFWVQTGGYDTHAAQGGTYATLMTTLNDGLLAFYQDLNNHALLNDTLVLQFSEFGRRIIENGSGGTDHGAASVMMAIGGQVRGGIYGTAASLSPDPANPTLENGANDVRYETDFRSVYARVIDNWLGADSAAILGGDFRGGPGFL